MPVIDGRPPQAGGEGDGGDVQDQVRRAAEGRVDRHRVADRAIVEDVAEALTGVSESDERSRGAAGHVEPDRLARGRQRGVGDRQSEGLGDDLRRGGGTEELAAAAGAAASAAAQFRRLGQRQLAVGVARPDRLDLAGVFPVARRQRHSPGDQHTGKMLRARQGHHHRGQALVARGDAQHTLPPRQRADQPAEDDGRVVAIRQAVHHAGRALGAAVAWVGDHPGERHDVEPAQLFGRLADQEADLPVAGVITQGDRLAVGTAHAPLRAQDEIGIAGDLARRPAHARILRQAEEIARRPFPQHFAGQRERSFGTISGRRDFVDGGITRIDHGFQIQDRRSCFQCHL